MLLIKNAMPIFYQDFLDTAGFLLIPSPFSNLSNAAYKKYCPFFIKIFLILLGFFFHHTIFIYVSYILASALCYCLITLAIMMIGWQSESTVTSFFFMLFKLEKWTESSLESMFISGYTW